MPLSETIRTRLAMKSLLLHKLRSSLTLGIVFGVFGHRNACDRRRRQRSAAGAAGCDEHHRHRQATSRLMPTEADVTRHDGTPVAGLLRLIMTCSPKPLTIMGRSHARNVSEARYLQKTLNVRPVGCTTEYPT